MNLIPGEISYPCSMTVLRDSGLYIRVLKSIPYWIILNVAILLLMMWYM